MSSIMCTNGWGGEELEVKGADDETNTFQQLPWTFNNFYGDCFDGSRSTCLHDMSQEWMGIVKHLVGVKAASDLGVFVCR